MIIFLCQTFCLEVKKKKMVIGIWYQNSKSTSMMTKNEIIFFLKKMKGIKSIKQKKQIIVRILRINPLNMRFSS